ncbi:MAG: hypothetical protein K1X35_13045 [Caulobacteraceae bacterium]|nr:hypothetical protein [Caulobacteraceae bacterium]
MFRTALTFALCAATAFSVPAAAQIEPARPQAAIHWRALAEADLEAAYALLRDNHPAAAPEAGDDAFRSNLERALAEGRARVARVDSYAGYAATLNAFAVAMGDKHIWSRQAVRPATYFWTGLSIARRGDGWWVAEDARDGAQEALAGARLIGCDGRSADDLGRERIGTYRAVWSVEAQRVQNAPWLLIDDGNPFLTRPSACEFEQGDERTTLTLAWSRIGPVGLSPHITKAVNVGEAGFGVRRFAGGYWIALESLNPRARAVVDAVKAQADDMRDAPMVVLDLRGNGGGDSDFGEEIAVALMGQPYVRRALSSGPDCEPQWRASPGNLEGLQTFLAANSGSMDPQSRAYWQGVARDLEAAVRAGRPFGGTLAACPGADTSEPPPLDGRGSLLKGRMVILTDAECFSSCLLVTPLFRRLGALHVGGATDAATRYMEVREVVLPSGISYASTLQKISPGAPRQIGPFIPSRLFQGSMSDTPALEAWVGSL